MTRVFHEYDITERPFPPHPRSGQGLHPSFRDVSGMKFVRLAVLHYCGTQPCGQKKIAIWACRCDCGNTIPVWSNSLVSEKTTSCGCRKQEASSEANSADLIGQSFGRLSVVERLPGIHGEALWICACSCGDEKVASTDHLRRGAVRSCGCLKRETDVASTTTHGMSRSPEHNSWKALKGRCLNPNNDAFDRYGGRGISVCPEWLDSFETFFRDMGTRPSPSHSIDRYPDNDGNYEPGNCRWAAALEQANNRRDPSWRPDHGVDGRFLEREAA